MRWKELLIGAAVTLVVTVIGGLLVYFFTQEKNEPKIEELTYQLDKQVSFEGSDNLISIGALKFSNIGNEPAKTVIAEFKLDGAKVIEFKIQNEGGAEISKSISEDKRSITLRIKSLLPNEIVSATYLLNESAKVDFSMRSDRTIGSEGSIYRFKTERSSILNDFLGDFVPVLMLIFLAALLYLLKYQRSNRSREDSKNNNGFVLLHRGATDEALSIFESAVSNGIDGSHAMSNYASALAISGETDKAKVYIEASEFLAKSKHEKALCNFNKSILLHCIGDNEGCLSSLEKSLQQSKSEIKLYFKNSKIMDDIASSSSNIRVLVDNA